MFAVETEYLVRQEQYKDRRRDVARWQLIQIAQPRRSRNIVTLRSLAGWLGTQMVKVGSKLQHYNQYQHQMSSR